MRFGWVNGLSVAAVTLMMVSSAKGEPERASTMRPVIEQYQADNIALEQTYSFDLSQAHMQRFKAFYASELATLPSIDFDRLDHEDQVDYLLLRNLLVSQQHQWAIRQKQIDEMQPLLPFEKNVESLLDAKRLMQKPDAEKSRCLTGGDDEADCGVSKAV